MKYENKIWLDILGEQCPKSREHIVKHSYECFDSLMWQVHPQSIKLLAHALDPGNEMHNNMLYTMVCKTRHTSLFRYIEPALRVFGYTIAKSGSDGVEWWFEYDSNGNMIPVPGFKRCW